MGSEFSSLTAQVNAEIEMIFGMNNNRFILLICMCLIAGYCRDGFAQTPTPSIDDVLKRVRTNITTYIASLPSFECEEHIDSKETRSGQVIHQTQLTSLLRVKHTEEPTQPLVELRRIQTVDGRPAKKKTYHLPLSISGAFDDAFANLFDERTANCYQYALEPPHDSDNAPLVLSMSLRPDARAISACAQIAPDSSAKVYLDTLSYQIVGLKTRFPHSHIRDFSDLHISYGYSVVSLSGKKFLLPESVDAELTNSRSGSALQYEATYTDYHKFDVTMTIIPSPNEGDQK